MPALRFRSRSCEQRPRGSWQCRRPVAGRRPPPFQFPLVHSATPIACCRHYVPSSCPTEVAEMRNLQLRARSWNRHVGVARWLDSAVLGGLAGPVGELDRREGDLRLLRNAETHRCRGASRLGESAPTRSHARHFVRSRYRPTTELLDWRLRHGPANRPAARTVAILHAVCGVLRDRLALCVAMLLFGRIVCQSGRLCDAVVAPLAIQKGKWYGTATGRPCGRGPIFVQRS